MYASALCQFVQVVSFVISGQLINAQDIANASLQRKLNGISCTVNSPLCQARGFLGTQDQIGDF
jgi:hypothetical protein